MLGCVNNKPITQVDMPRANIYLSSEVQKRLAEYREREWGGHHSLAPIVQKAIKQFLDGEEKAAREEREETR